MSQRKQSGAQQLFDDHRFKHALTNTARVLAEDSSLELALGNQPYEDPLERNEMIVLSSAAPADDTDPKRYLRGQADIAALALRHHNAVLHQQLRPSDVTAAPIFDALERTRIEALGAANMQGIQHNLQHYAEVHCAQQGYAHYTDESAPPLPDILAMILREALIGSPPPNAIAPLVSGYKPKAIKASRETLESFLDVIEDQETFAKRAKEWLRDLSLLPELQSASPEPNEADPSDDDDAQELNTDAQQEDDEQQAPPPPSGHGDDSDEQADDGEQEQAAPSPDDASGPQHETTNQFRPNAPLFDALKPLSSYHAYTDAFDEIVEADTLCAPEDLQLFRAQLDEQLKAHQNVHTRLAAKLQRLLLARQAREWMYDQEDGLIDNARLARLIIDPERREIYKYEKPSEFRDSCVTLLIDNSGSMRGRPITIAAMSADILARTLERCGVRVEILGFTTQEWKGGLSRKAWEKAGKPPSPGRLNDLRHIIYKSADMRMNKARRNLGLMLKDGLLKENIDGEALLWAHQRLLARPEQRRILMVISDGAPVDDATLSSNSAGYLDQHLRDVIEMIELRSEVELTAIGIGHDVGRYYSRAITIHEVEALGDTMLSEMMRLFEN
jgi:cobaltochelatase CobT